MGFLSWVRRKGFWICDRLFMHGDHWRFYKEVRDAYQNGTDDAAVRHKIEDILKHAAATTEFYASYEGILELDKFPIVNKIDYQQRWDKFVSSAYAGAPKCHLESTSGSTGTPLEILYDQRKSRRRNATSIFLNTLADFRIGDRQAYLRVWINRVQKSFIKKWVMNLITVDTANLNDAHLQEICDIFKHKRVKAIAGYASSLSMLALYIRDHNIDCSKLGVKTITPTSETVSPYIRNELKKQFNCTVSSIYGAEEFGTIGIQTKDSDDYYMDTSGFFYEVLKMEEDVPAEDGEAGRLVITDLYNYAFPLIRYENGDVVERKTVKTNKGKYRQYFTQIYGRKIDLIYDTNGEPVSPHAISIKMWGIENISQWKFIQTGMKTYRFVINGKKADEAGIRSMMCEELGKDAEILFEYVDDIPVLSLGKRKYIENQYRKN
ncbi:MAG: phenylacetate--CoA ligase family protein [Lachnospiraceae bacterium]|nr:phenylacetate--CoA ligase family protein [Lachnospiraceae bacterium]